MVYIGSDLPKEYTGSKYTNSIKGTNAKAKANAATGIPELIEIAVGKHFRENNEDKHRRDGKNGWYRYDSKFALPVYDDNGKVERYNIFHCIFLYLCGMFIRCPQRTPYIFNVYKIYLHYSVFQIVIYILFCQEVQHNRFVLHFDIR